MTSTQDPPAASFRVLVRVVLSSPILLAILLLAVSAAAEGSTPAPERETLLGEARPARSEPVRAPRTSLAGLPGLGLLGLDLLGLRGSLVDDDAHHASGYTASWGRGPRARSEGALGLVWGWHF